MNPQKPHREFLLRLFTDTVVEVDFIDSPCYKELVKRIEGIRGKIPTDWLSLIDKSFDLATSKLSKIRCSLCLAHRDFTPWNTYFAKGRLSVFDWEFAREAWPPMTDAFHFITQKSILVDKMPPTKLFNLLLNEPSTSQGLFLSDLSRRILAKPFSTHHLLLFYLTDISTTYFEHFIKHRSIDPNGRMLLSTWKHLMKFALSC